MTRLLPPLALAAFAAFTPASLQAQFTSQSRSVSTSAYYLDPYFGEDPVFQSNSQSTLLPGPFTAHVDATAGGFGSVANGKADQFGTIDSATGTLNLHGYAFAQLYVQGTANVASQSRAQVDFTLVNSGGVYFPDADLSTYDAFLGEVAHDRPGQAYAEVRIETVPAGVVLYERRVEMGEPGLTLQEDFVYLEPGAYRIVLEAGASDTTNGVEEIGGSVAAATFDIVAEISGLGELDTTPPAPPSGLAATAGDQSVSLGWSANGEPDLSGYRVHRAPNAGGPFTPIADVSGTSFEDLTVSNGTTYFYRVTALDTSSNESAPSSSVQATPQAPVASSLHVLAIVPSTIPAPGNKRKAVAQVTVRDNLGAPVAGATVVAVFTGKPSGTYFAVTDASGIATITTAAVKPPLSFSVCVQAVSHATLTYAPSENVETCDSY
jgi:hypothetical protein